MIVVSKILVCFHISLVCNPVSAVGSFGYVELLLKHLYINTIIGYGINKIDKV